MEYSTDEPYVDGALLALEVNDSIYHVNEIRD